MCDGNRWHACQPWWGDVETPEEQHSGHHATVGMIHAHAHGCLHVWQLQWAHEWQCTFTVPKPQSDECMVC